MIDPLRTIVCRLDQELCIALSGSPVPASVQRIRATARRAMELAGGAPDSPPADVLPWERDTLTETELALAFVLGSIERALRRPDQATLMLRAARARTEDVRRLLDRHPSA